MWCFRRQFDVRSSSVLTSSASIDQELEAYLQPGDHITAMKYVVVPVEAPTGFEMLSSEAILGQGEYPDHWLRTWHLLGTRDSPSKAGAFLQWLHHTRHAEFILLGLSNGGVYMVDITSGRMPPQEVRTLVAPPTDKVEEEDAKVDGVDGIVGMDTSGTIMAAAIQGGAAVQVSFFFPSIKPICTIPVPSDTKVSTVRLWEGAWDWMDIKGEETALYLYMGTEDGAVRLWRIDVMWDQHKPTTKPFMLHSLFQMHHRSTIAQPASSASTTTTDAPPSLVAVPGAVRDDLSALQASVKCLELHDVDGDKENGSGGRGRLVAGTSKCLAAWDLSAVPHIPSPSPFEAPLPTPEVVAARIATRLLASGGEVSDSGPAAVTLPVEWLVGSSTMSWVREDSEKNPSNPTPIGCVGVSRLTGQRVYVTCGRSTLQAACESQAGATPVKAKHGLVCDGLEVGSIVDVVVTSKGGGDGAVSVLCGVLFPSLKKSVLWPLECLDVVVPSALIAMKADSVGPVYSVAAMSSTRMVTGGADGSVKVWEWAKGVFSVVQSATRHSDLVKQVIPVRRPDVFLSSSYDGTVREWHMYDSPQPLLNCQNTTIVSIGARDASSGGDVQPVGVVDYFPAFNALFAAPLFDTRIKTYTIMETQGCELPPNMIYDGERTRRITAPPVVDEATPATGAIADVLQQVTSE